MKAAPGLRPADFCKARAMDSAVRRLGSGAGMTESGQSLLLTIILRVSQLGGRWRRGFERLLSLKETLRFALREAEVC
jgi:hypothetical protein